MKPAKHKPLPVVLERAEILWLLVVALATAGPHASHLPLWLSILSVTIVAARTWLWLRNQHLPPRWLLTLLAVASAAGIGFEYRTLFGKDAGVALLFLFMALKPMEMRTRRDGLVVVMLGFFLLLTHYFESQSIPTGLWLLACTVLLTATLIRLHGGNQPLLTLLRQAGLLVIQALPFLLVLYLLFPRVTGPLWGLPQDAYSGLSGLSNQMSPGSLNNLIQSGAIAFRVQFAGSVPEKSQLYWRGPSFDDYDGQTWRPLARLPQSPRRTPSIETTGQTFDYVTTLEAHNQRWLLALDAPVSLPDNSRLAESLEVLNREPVRKRSRFSFRSAPDYLANREESAAILQQTIRLPPLINPRTRELAAAWRDRFKSPELIAGAALRHFREEQFFYTLRPPLLGPQAIDDFLFNTRRGFCEHYASAFVFLMRSAGVPARVVAGYQGGEINPIDGYLTVRQSDAHAWAEIWISGRGWLRIDPTAAVAPSRIEQGIEAALPEGEALPALVRIDTDLLRDLRNRWEAVNNAWNQWVLGYNPQRQRELLSRLGFSEPDWREMTAALALLCGFSLLCLVAWNLRHRKTLAPAVRLWLKYCRRMEKLGIARMPWEGSLAFAERVARSHPDPALALLTSEAARNFAELHYGAGAPQHLKQLRECVQQLPTFWRKTV